MEMRAYLEGMRRKWWLLLLILVLSVIISREINANLTSQFSASTTVLLNDQLFANSAFPSGAVQLGTASSYIGAALNPAVLRRITVTYPYMTLEQMQKDVVVSTDSTNQTMLISVTTITPFAASDIANFIARQFVKSQKAQLIKQLDYYQQSLQQSVSTLNTQVNQLNAQIDALTTQQTALSPSQMKLLRQNEETRNLANRMLYLDQEALVELHNVTPLAQDAFKVISPASTPLTPVSSPPSPSTILVECLGGGLLLFMIISVSLDFLTPAIRHKGELPLIAGVPLFVEASQLSRKHQQRLLSSPTLRYTRRIKQLRVLCAALGTLVVKQRGCSVLFTSPENKRHFATSVATFLARTGLHVLLINTNPERPDPADQVGGTKPANLYTPAGMSLPFINATAHPNLFYLPAQAAASQGQAATGMYILELLPALQQVFDLIIIDAPPLQNVDTHLLAPKVTQVFMLVKKRRDRIQAIKKAHAAFDVLETNTRYVFLT